MILECQKLYSDTVPIERIAKSIKMDIESLENMDKSEFLPLSVVKQELLDTANGIDNETTETVAENNEINSASINDTVEPVEINNPVCDSAEKQVIFHASSF